VATVYCINEAELSVNDVRLRRIFEEIDQTRISTKSAYKPKGGEVYVYEYGDATTKGKQSKLTFTTLFVSHYWGMCCMYVRNVMYMYI